MYILGEGLAAPSYSSYMALIDSAPLPQRKPCLPPGSGFTVVHLSEEDSYEGRRRMDWDRRRVCAVVVDWASST